MRNLPGTIQTAVLLAGIWATFFVVEAMAQNRDWAKPINDKISLLATGLQGLAVGLAIVGIIIAAFGYVVQQRIDTTKVAAVLVGAALATLASALVPAFFN